MERKRMPNIIKGKEIEVANLTIGSNMGVVTSKSFFTQLLQRRSVRKK